MSNALAVKEPEETAIELSDLDRAMIVAAAEETDAFDYIPPRIKISPGGINQWVTGDNETMKSFVAIVVVSQKARAYWPEKGTGQPPMCVSVDGATGHFPGQPSEMQLSAAGSAHMPHPIITALNAGAALPTTFACAACPLSQFGSAHQGGVGKSQGCKALRRLVVVIDGWAAPALLTLPPTSIKSFDAYASGLKQRGQAYFGVKTQFALEGQKSGMGDPYSVASFATAGALSEDEKRMVMQARAQYASLVRELPIDATEYDTAPSTGAAVSGSAEPDIPW